MRRSLAALLALGLGGSSGCSFFLVDRYHEPKAPGDPVHCTASHKWPIIDGAVALAAYAASVYLGHYPSDDLPVYTGNAAGAVGIGFGVSALYGVYSVHRCRDGLEAAKSAAPAAEVPIAPPAEPEVAPPPPAAEPEAAPAVTDEPSAAEPEAPKAAPPKKKHKKKKSKK